MNLQALTSAIYNNVIGGLKGINDNVPLTLEQVEDSIINERLLLIKEYSLKNLLPRKSLTSAIRCIPLDCSDIERCCTTTYDKSKIKHFEIPKLILDYGSESVEYIGPSDHSSNFKLYLNHNWKYHTYRMRGSNKPFVWIDTAANKNDMFDGFLFNQDFMKDLTIEAIFQDPRHLKKFSCCVEQDYNDYNFLQPEIEKRLSQKFLYYYRQVAPTQTPNDAISRP